ncbi:MAG: DUF3667 domain-containing protein [Bacteroidota bacterium]
MPKKLRKSTYCLNCGKVLTDANNFCPDCGQQNTATNVTLGILFRDLLDDFLSYDSRLTKSVVPLLLKPGLLTKEYNAGKRIKFFPPLRMYFIISVIFFLIPSVEEPQKDNEQTATVYESYSDSSKIRYEASGGTDDKKDLTHIGFSTDSAGNRGINFDISNIDKSRLTEKQYVDSIINGVIDSLHIEKETLTASMIDRTGRKLLGMIEDGGEKFVKDLQNNIPTMVFFLLPVFAFLLKILYFRIKPLYVECLIFSLHFHSFAFIIFAIQSLLNFFGVFNKLIEFGGLLLICFYLVAALRNVFRRNYFKTILKFLLLSLTYVACLAISYAMTFLITLLLY